jgi:hypothetical protein
MNKYGETAIKAFEYIKAGANAEQAWEKASCDIFEKGSASQKKGCPRNAFLGLTSNNSKIARSKNAIYARKALDILKGNPNRSYTVDELWSLVIDEPKTHNSQMDIVLALWGNKLIR